MLRFLLLASLIACSLGAATRRRPRLDDRIVGGRPVTIEEFPYQVSYIYNYRHICGGSIISKEWVVTAAQCTDRTPVTSSSFRAGSSIRESGGIIHDVAQIAQHPLYYWWTLDFDISVVRVFIPFYTDGPTIRPIPLTISEPAAGFLAVVSGWGTFNFGETDLPSQLQAVDVYTISRDECISDYASYAGITVNMICAGVSGGGKDACEYDTGGPLVVNGVLVGIVSWGRGCAMADYPGVYSNIASLRSFITEQTGVQ